MRRRTLALLAALGAALAAALGLLLWWMLGPSSDVPTGAEDAEGTGATSTDTDPNGPDESHWQSAQDAIDAGYGPTGTETPATGAGATDDDQARREAAAAFEAQNGAEGNTDPYLDAAEEGVGAGIGGFLNGFFPFKQIFAFWN